MAPQLFVLLAHSPVSPCPPAARSLPCQFDEGRRYFLHVSTQPKFNKLAKCKTRMLNVADTDLRLTHQ